MNTDNEKCEEIQLCAKCGKSLPIVSDEGKNNFCPASDGTGKIINLCMECKIKDIAEHGKNG